MSNKASSGIRERFEKIANSIAKSCHGNHRDRSEEIQKDLEKLHLENVALRAYADLVAADSRYRTLTGAQSFTLYVCEQYAMRINLWYPTSQRLPTNAAALQNKYFSHMMGHNHNYDFYTIGLLGPGYHSTFFAVDTDISSLNEGDKVPFSRSWEMDLGIGKPFFVRREVEFHTQYPAEEFSISLNVIPYASFSKSGRQYTLTDCGERVRRVLVGETLEDRARKLV